MKKQKTKIQFDRVFFRNRWAEKYVRSGDWVIIGVQEWWAGPNDFCYKICFFGFDLHFWFKREFISNQPA